ncbi:calcium-dependent lipid-binding family protein [Striga asiatica]|uniref:Calcium-dependent lipid-binding family protein n=1 Tax=Striga asiatica TaxID=4170 RepID=A0A5A7R8L2_STRAF|nr:calcium-dependent lipid-binding family protein [Striga asiatica]
MGSITDATILHHVCVVLLLLWCLNSFECCHPVAYFLSLIYLYLVHEGYVLKLRKKLQFEEKRESNQRRVLSESETVRWLNHAVEKIWLICIEEIVSQKILLPIFPWFLKKYKPWTVKDVELQHLYLGRSPPIITDMRVVQHSNGDDHLVLELGMNFRTADDMSAILGVKLRKRLGFGMWAKLHLLGMHVEGKVLVGVKFIRSWPFISRLRVCFAGPPYFQMTVKPIFTHGLDVTELPGIAGWIDNLLALVFEQTLVEVRFCASVVSTVEKYRDRSNPNMLVVDVVKFASPQPENWFSVDAKDPIAHAIVEVLEATEMKPSDLNGLADPYVKGQLGPYRFRTKTQKKTLAPKWREEFKIPICSWESDNILVIEVRDKDRIFDDTMGDCCVNINELRDGQRHDMWLPLQNIKMGRLHLAVTVSEGTAKVVEAPPEAEILEEDNLRRRTSFTDDSSPRKDSFSREPSGKSSQKSLQVADKFEPIDIEGQSDTGLWIHHPGSEVAQVWEPRKGKNRAHHQNGLIQGEMCENDGTTSTDESTEPVKSPSKVRRGLRKISSVFHRGPRDDDKSSGPGPIGLVEESPRENIRASNSKEVGVRWIMDESIMSKVEESEVDGGNGPGSPRGNVKGVAKSILKQAGKSARSLKSVLSRKSRAGGDKEAFPNGESSEDDEEEDSLSSVSGGPDLVVPGLAVTNESKSVKSSDGFVQTEASTSGKESSKSTDNHVVGPSPTGTKSCDDM